MSKEKKLNPKEDNKNAQTDQQSVPVKENKSSPTNKPSESTKEDIFSPKKFSIKLYQAVCAKEK